MNYTLDIQELREFEGGHLGWWSKGHHEPDDFVASIAELDWADCTVIDRSRIRHEHWRCVPVGPGERGSLFVSAKVGTRGSFPVTAVED